MEKFYAATALILLTVILVLVIRKQNGEIALLLGLCGCCMVFAVAAGLLIPIVNFLRRLQQNAALDGQMLQILMKITAVAFTGEIACAVCADAGNGALAKSLQILTTVTILYLSLPMLEALLTLVERILVAL